MTLSLRFTSLTFSNPIPTPIGWSNGRVSGSCIALFDTMKSFPQSADHPKVCRSNGIKMIFQECLDLI